MGIMGSGVAVAVTNGRLDFGTWKRIFCGEFDGQCRKALAVKIAGERTTTNRSRQQPVL
jgi:thiamine phosphate synthase YjbQ (UPF0047 family)